MNTPDAPKTPPVLTPIQIVPFLLTEELKIKPPYWRPSDVKQIIGKSVRKINT